ncbi:uncharacterized protein LOC134264557 [Saccostrea cucullata]|uniref:uncharacterized protein LOC134264557 n=1 Tax=Saccostrea cuccullata TaxID=36930 RepID=UPI002ED03080
MVSGSVCQNNRCVCGPGYKSFHDSECLSRVLDPKEDKRVNLTVGSFIGGLILGIVLTLLGVIVYKYIKNWNSKAEKGNTQRLQFLTTLVMKLKEMLIMIRTFPSRNVQISEFERF